jgi:hypothetical protein
MRVSTLTKGERLFTNGQESDDLSLMSKKSRRASSAVSLDNDASCENRFKNFELSYD